MNDSAQNRRVVHGLLANAARWTAGLLADRFAACRDVMIPSMIRLMTQTERHRFLGNFFVASGAEEGRHRGPKWDDGDFYKLLEAACLVTGGEDNPALGAFIRDSIAAISAAQRDDGYIHTPTLIRARTDPSARPFENPMDFEMYNVGHLLSAACAHHAMGGETSLLSVAIKAAGFVDREFTIPTPDRARHGICPWHLVGLVELSRRTGQRRWVDLAERLLAMRDLVEKGDDDNQDRIPFLRQRTAHGHAVRATYLYAGAADVYAETGKAEILQTLEAIWDDLVTRKLYITGGCGALFDGASPDGATDQTIITRVHQAFGRHYQLPNAVAHNETCAAIGNLLFNRRMFEITGDAKYADLVEHTLYNSVLAGVGLDGQSFFYTNTLRQLNPMPVSDLRWPRRRQKTLGTFCCPPNVLRTIARSPQFAYALGPRALWVTLYGASVVSTHVPGVGEVALAQHTDYPWDENIRITIDAAPPDERWSLRVRIPGWCTHAVVRVNGNPLAPPPMPGSFLSIDRAWKVGDRVEINLAMPARRVEAHPYVEETRNHVAVARGPIVYCLESIDLPPGVRVLDVRLPGDSDFSTVPGEGVLAGMTLLTTRALAFETGDWTGRLYRDHPTEPAREIGIMLIPYFAWENRGESEMSVWIPLAG